MVSEQGTTAANHAETATMRTEYFQLFIVVFGTCRGWDIVFRIAIAARSYPRGGWLVVEI